MTYLKIFIFILLTTAAFSQTVVPISEMRVNDANGIPVGLNQIYTCLLYTSDAADERSSVDLGGRRIIKKKKKIYKKK